jgi:hypothetical protein
MVLAYASQSIAIIELQEKTSSKMAGSFCLTNTIQKITAET